MKKPQGSTSADRAAPKGTRDAERRDKKSSPSLLGVSSTDPETATESQDQPSSELALISSSEAPGEEKRGALSARRALRRLSSTPRVVNVKGSKSAVAQLDISELEVQSLTPDFCAHAALRDSLSRFVLVSNRLTGPLPSMAGLSRLNFLNLSKNSGLSWRDIAQAELFKTNLVTLSVNELDFHDMDPTRFVEQLGLPAHSLKVLLASSSKLTGRLILKGLNLIETVVVSKNQLTHIELLDCPNVSKLSAGDNPALVACPSIETCAPRLLELRLAHCSSIKGLSLRIGFPRLNLLDLSGCSDALSDWKQIEAAVSLENLALKGTKLVADLEGENYEREAKSRFPRLRFIDYKKVSTTDVGTKRSFGTRTELEEKFALKEKRRKLNLVSTKLHAPDPTKLRNKPCKCGSGKKTKLCCGDAASTSKSTKDGDDSEADSGVDLKDLKRRNKEELAGGATASLSKEDVYAGDQSATMEVQEDDEAEEDEWSRPAPAESDDLFGSSVSKW